MSRDFFDDLAASLKEAVSLAKGADTSPAAETLPRQDTSQDRAGVLWKDAPDNLLEGFASVKQHKEVDWGPGQGKEVW